MDVRCEGSWWLSARHVTLWGLLQEETASHAVRLLQYLGMQLSKIAQAPGQTSILALKSTYGPFAALYGLTDVDNSTDPSS